MTTTLVGFPQIAAAGLNSNSSTALTNVGTYCETNDGRGFRYCLVGGVSTVVGKLYQSPAQDTTNLNPSGGLSIAAAAAGATQIVTTSTVTLTANQAAGGLIGINVTPGVGYVYRIASHAAATAAVVTFNLEDPIVVALTTSSKAVVALNPYNGVIVNPATASGAPVGVAQYIITNGNYGWIQTHGPALLLNDSATAVGLGVAPSAAVAGASKTMAATLAQIGYALNAGVTTEYDFVFLTID